LAFNFFVAVFRNFYYGIWIQHKNMCLLIPIVIFCKLNILGSYLHFLDNLNPNTVKTAQKNFKSFFYKCVLESVLAPISTLAFSIFSKKTSKSIYPIVLYCIYGFTDLWLEWFPSANNYFFSDFFRFGCL